MPAQIIHLETRRPRAPEQPRRPNLFRRLIADIRQTYGWVRFAMAVSGVGR